MCVSPKVVPPALNYMSFVKKSQVTLCVVWRRLPDGAPRLWREMPAAKQRNIQVSIRCRQEKPAAMQHCTRYCSIPALSIVYCMGMYSLPATNAVNTALTKWVSPTLFRARKKERRRSTVDAAQKGAQQGTSFYVGGTRGRGNVLVCGRSSIANADSAKSCMVYVCRRLYKPVMDAISMGYHSMKAKKPPLSGRFSLTWRGCLTPCSSGRPRRSACSRWLPAPAPL